MNTKLSVQNVYKIFGDQPENAMNMVTQGQSKDDIFAQTGHTLGVKDASFDIYEGEIFVIMGLSGSGKSTMVRMLNRLIEPTQGKIILDDVNIAQLNEEELRQIRLHKISMVFQSFALMPHLTVLENVTFGLDLAGDLDIKTRQQHANEALDRVGLLPNAQSFPNELSGGMQQRVGLARALCINPDVLLMDEAFSALDPLIRTEMQDELIRLQAEDKRTIVFISHDLDEAVRIGDRIAIMQDGEVVQVGTPDDIINQPPNDYVRSFFRGVDVSHVLRAKDIAHPPKHNLIAEPITNTPSACLATIENSPSDFGYVVQDQIFSGMVSNDSLNNASTIKEGLIGNSVAIQADTQLQELINQVASEPFAPPVINDKGEFIGVVSKTALLEALSKETGEAS